MFCVSAAAMVGAAACASGPARPAAFPGAPSRVAASPVVDSDVATAVLQTALSLTGTAYRLGGADPKAGFDCSGLVRYAFGQHHLVLPRTVAEQYQAAVPVDRHHPTPGDLLFFSTTAPGPSHVGIVVDDTRFVHAPGTGQVVRIDRFDTPYWRSRLLRVGRAALTPPSAEATRASREVQTSSPATR